MALAQKKRRRSWGTCSTCQIRCPNFTVLYRSVFWAKWRLSKKKYCTGPFNSQERLRRVPFKKTLWYWFPYHHHHLIISSSSSSSSSSLSLFFFLLPFSSPSLFLSRSSFSSIFSAPQWRRKSCPSNPLRESGC